MARDYKIYLAGEVLSDGKIVTYRLLARSMVVHVSEAKRMLFDFHCRENLKKADSVHANYLVSGFQKLATGAVQQTTRKACEDVQMRSSPAPVSPVPQAYGGVQEPRVKVFTLVREEELEKAKELYEEVTSIFVYSIQPGSFKNMGLLANIHEQVYLNYQKEDPLDAGKIYGVIQNPSVKRRSGTRPPPPAAATLASQPSQPVAKAVAAASQVSTKSFVPRTVDRKSYVETESTNTSSTTAARPSTIRRESSDIFKSFAKTKEPKLKHVSGNDDEEVHLNSGGPLTDSSARGAHSMPVSNMSNELEMQQDVQMADHDDNDEGDDFVAPTVKNSNIEHIPNSERDEELRKKMFGDDEDEEMGDTPTSVPEPAADEDGEDDKSSAADAGMDPEAEDDSRPIVALWTKDDEATEQKVTVRNGRRRGRRQIMKKRMIKDADGYLVTREEPCWESFSEEDVPAPKQKGSAPTSSAGSKKGSQTAKKGQGNIMSFFGKR